MRRFVVHASDSFSGASVPSVSITKIAKSLFFKYEVDIHIPRVHAKLEHLVSNVFFSPKNWERKYDLPLRYGPQIESTPIRLGLILRISSNAFSFKINFSESGDSPGFSLITLVTGL